ncbi:MAG TPA: SRPBCC family protein [Chitinophagaceae bacterium]|nr:SRPBCC family protein [Chitinophagaceae bacterium]
MPTPLTTSPDYEIVSSRIVNAPRELVYRAWAEPEHLKNWWGPKGFSNTFHEFDFRVGGRWKFIMHGPEKGNYPNECEFTQIDKPSLIAWKRYSKPLFRVVAAFEEVAESKTKIIFKQIFDTAEECSKVKKFAVEKNEENFDRLEDELRKMVHNDDVSGE